MSSGALPTFIIIGAAKCATTSLHHHIGTHPKVQVSRRKELRFFMDRPRPGFEWNSGRAMPRGEWRRGLDWYRSWFDPAAPLRGEATPGYTSPRFEGIVDRMAHVVPDAKLIYCVRDPVERAVSHYRQAVSDQYETRPATAALTPDSLYVETSRYADRLSPFLKRWPRERVLIVEREELATDPERTLRRVLDFLGADPGLAPPPPTMHLNATVRKSGRRWRALQALRRRPWWPYVAERVPQRALPAVDRLTTNRPGRGGMHAAPVPERLMEAIRGAVADDAARFRSLAGRDFHAWTV